MKRTVLAAAGGLIALALASFLLPEDEVAFGPEAGTKLTKTFTGEIDFALDDYAMTMNGEEQDMPMDEEPAGTMAYSVIVNDHFESMEGRRPTKLLRSFVELFGSVETSEGDSEEGSWDELEGATVSFAWDEEEEDYEITFDEGDADDEVLNALTPDMDFRVLLPSDPVSEDDEWSIRGKDLMGVLLPGIDLKRAAEADVELDGDPIPEEFMELIDEFLSGVDASCTYKGSAEDEGTEVAEIEFKAEISGNLDIDPSMFGEDADALGSEMEIEIQIDMTLEGTLLWNAAGGHFHSFVLEGDGTLGAHMVTSIPDFDMEFEMEMLASVGIEQSATAELSE